jgi:hypothetical protein
MGLHPDCSIPYRQEYILHFEFLLFSDYISESNIPIGETTSHYPVLPKRNYYFLRKPEMRKSIIIVAQPPFI